jgi:hypothetical protein
MARSNNDAAPRAARHAPLRPPTARPAAGGPSSPADSDYMTGQRIIFGSGMVPLIGSIEDSIA